MAKRTFTDESLATLVDETKLYVDSKSYHSNKSILDNTTASYTTDEKTKLSGIATGAEVNQNTFSNVKVGSTTVVADSKTDTIEFVGSNVTITPDATNDKITFAVANGSTSAKGIVQLTDSTSSTSTTTAATPKNVKAAYDLANTAKTNAATVQSNLDAHIDDKNNPHEVDCEQIGAYPKSGGNVSGQIGVNDGYGSVEAYDANITIRTRNAKGDDLNSRRITLFNSGNKDLTSALSVVDTVNGASTAYKLYGEHNKPTAIDVGAVQREIFWYNPESHSDKLVTFIWTLINQGYTSGVIQVDGAYPSPTDVPTSVTNKLGTYYTCVFQKHGYGFVDAELYGDGATISYRNRSQIGENAWKHDWIESFNYNGYLPLTGGTISSTLTVNGNTIFNSDTYMKGVLDVCVNYGGEGGEIRLQASPDTPTQSGVILDQCNSRFRIFGIPSADGTTRTGVGTPLVIDPYDKTIVGGYSLDCGSVNATGNMQINRGIPSFYFKIPGTNASASIYKNTSSTADYGLYFVDDATDGRRVALRLSANEQKAQLIIRSSSTASDAHYNIYGTHNVGKGTGNPPSTMANDDIWIKYS